MTSCGGIINLIDDPIYYLGDTYEPTEHVDVYYNMDDIDKEYYTIGILTSKANYSYSAQKFKKYMLESAKENGGEGIIFMNVVSTNYDDEEVVNVTADLIRYKE